MTLAQLISDFKLSAEYAQDLEKYKEILLQWNEVMNLTAITDDEEINVKHFLDCLSLFKTNYLEGEKSVIDVGTGAGFPGVVLKIYNRDLRITLMDSLNKRIKFLDEVVKELDLQGVETLHARAEELARNKDYRESYDVATSRAVANLSTLCEYTLPFVKIGGHLIAMKGPEYERELKEADRAIKTLGGELEEVLRIELPGDITHYLVVIKKINPTDKKYPRGGGKPKSKPL
ncbi:MAG: 16S rRNA (guanine(527)-N(7))-methyltransferase RsmG [Peptoniphilus sp.]|nr:16S rRNA (guanine(527)-N(7))-methyltransferase RsmG [Peptoniphilus sp.]